MQLKDRDAEKYLYEVFSQNPWHAGVNKLLGLFHLNKKGANVQNWIHRALLAGRARPGAAEGIPRRTTAFPPFPFSPVFEVKKIQWLGNRRILVAGTLRSGEKEKLLVLDAASLKTIKAFDYEGAIQDIFPSPRLDKVIFSTSAVENEKVYLYTLIAQGDAFKLKPVVGYALNMASVLAAFNAGGTSGLDHRRQPGRPGLHLAFLRRVGLWQEDGRLSRLSLPRLSLHLCQRPLGRGQEPGRPAPPSR